MVFCFDVKLCRNAYYGTSRNQCCAVTHRWFVCFHGSLYTISEFCASVEHPSNNGAISDICADEFDCRRREFSEWRANNTRVVTINTNINSGVKSIPNSSAVHFNRGDSRRCPLERLATQSRSLILLVIKKY